ncbi:hypothetical protein MLD38_013359 [Melastoma candidum]|uniref:Uncharacterized protein n=1 Tax=Melastoma candidum TaxID=119954 RepID=A0ACB9RAL3_9MYRT|nr:hypothetical protein MLD38_013359 [Melastoma candidum]
MPTPPISSLVESLKSTPKPTPHRHHFDLQDFDPLDQLTDHGIPDADVYKGVHRPTGDLYGLRVISADKPESVRRFAYNHATSMCKIRAANIINYFDVLCAADYDEVWIITEYVSGESLRRKQISDEGELSFITKRILCGMRDMHAQRRACRNLCPEHLDRSGF